MKEKIIVALLTVILTMAQYIMALPHRTTMMPGGELFNFLWVLIIWYVGHEFKKEVEKAEKGGYGINDRIED